ncbi:hypothetical protein ACI6Q2_12090 [Chitinophagaceae bacterium LWZ2-11]
MENEQTYQNSHTASSVANEKEGRAAKSLPAVPAFRRTKAPNPLQLKNGSQEPDKEQQPVQGRFIIKEQTTQEDTPPPGNPFKAGIQTSAAPVQRSVKINTGAGAGTYSDLMPFLSACEKQLEKYTLPADASTKMDPLLSTGTNVYETFHDLMTAIGATLKIVAVAAPKPVVVEAPPITVKTVGEKLGNPPELAEGTALALTPSAKKSSRSLFDVTISAKKYLLKENNQADKDEFEGMKQMAKAGIALPAVLSLTLSDNKKYVLMDNIEHLATGLSPLNNMSDAKLAKASLDLGKVHVVDIIIGNQDRLPWGGSKGHFYNVFIEMVSNTVLGLDSEARSQTSELQYKELKLIQQNYGDYAAKMFTEITRSDKDKATLTDAQKKIFIDNFILGLAAAMPKNIELYKPPEEKEKPIKQK